MLRELEVLDLAAQGKGVQDIAAELADGDEESVQLMLDDPEFQKKLREKQEQLEKGDIPLAEKLDQELGKLASTKLIEALGAVLSDEDKPTARLSAVKELLQHVMPKGDESARRPVVIESDQFDELMAELIHAVKTREDVRKVAAAHVN